MNGNISTENDYTGKGFLILNVFAADGAVPLEGAIVNISRNIIGETGIIGTFYTDRSGKTERIALPAPPKSMSQTPQEPQEPNPFATYNVEIIKDGYYTKTFVSLPVFDQTASFQSVNMLPITEVDGKNPSAEPQTEFVETENPEL